MLIPNFCPTSRTTIAALALMVSAPLVLAAPISLEQTNQPTEQKDLQTKLQSSRLDLLAHTPKKFYQGQMVISIHTTSQLQLDALLKLTESVWSERTGVGQLDIQIHRSNLHQISKLGIPHDVLIEDLQAHTDASWNEIIIQEQRDIQRQLIDQASGRRGVSVHDESWFSNYKQLADITDYHNNIATLRPDLASTMTIGQSWENRDITGITITAPDSPGNLRENRPVIYFFSTVHAREWIAPMTTTYFASKLVDDYQNDPRVTAILDTTRIVIVPVGNPDGYLYTWSDSRFWRNTRRDNGDGTFGVNINRNWGHEWGNTGSSGDTSSTNYRGTAPFSEPETQALRDLALSYGDKLIAHIDYHSYSQLILWPFGYNDEAVTPEPDRTFFDSLATDLSKEIFSYSGAFYEPMQSIGLYPAAGNSKDWFYGELGSKSLTFELRPKNAAAGGFDPSPDLILPTAQENYEAAKLFAQRVLEPISLWFEPGETIDAMLDNRIILKVTDGFETHDPESVTMYTRIGSVGQFMPTNMNPNGPASYATNISSIPCGSQVEYYFQASTTSGDLTTLPPLGSQAPLTVLTIGFLPVALEDTIELDTGWIVGTKDDTATAGIWTRMDPQGTQAQPENDHSPDGSICWVTDGFAGTDQNDRDVDGGYTTLTSPTFDATGLGDKAILSYWVWHSAFDFDSDPMTTRISNDNGNTWTTIEFYKGPGDQWVERQFPIADYVEPTDQIRIRFLAVDQFTDNTIEAAIDDVRVGIVGCQKNPADLNNDGTLNFFDVAEFLDALAAQRPVADFNQDGVWNFFDVAEFLEAFAEG